MKFLPILLASLSVGCAALPPPRVYEAARTKDPIVIDGCADESAWADAPWSAGFVDITGDPAKAPIYSTRVKLLWNEEALYVFADLEEPKVTASLVHRDDVIWKDNDFEIFIDPDGDGENYYEFEFNALNTVFDLFLVRPYDLSEPTFVLHHWDAQGLESAVRIKGTLNDAHDRDEGWSLEVKIPSAALANGFELPFVAGRTIRVGFSRVEWLNREREENWTWGPTGVVNMHLPHRWGRVKLKAD